MKLTEDQFKEYSRDPNKNQDKVRKWLKIPDTKYFSVTVFPTPGKVTVTLHREVKNKKISKSDET